MPPISVPFQALFSFSVFPLTIKKETKAERQF